MSKRKIDLDVKIQAMQESLHLQDTESIARKYGVSKRSLYVWFDSIKDALPEILREDKTGPKEEPPRLVNTGDAP